MSTLWDKNQEIDFFTRSLGLATPEQLFYLTNAGKYFAYWPKGYEGDKNALQSSGTRWGKILEETENGCLREGIELFVHGQELCRFDC